jgi:hypothetical protein
MERAALPVLAEMVGGMEVFTRLPCQARLFQT